ncbi:TPA: hypothetical protein H1005_03865 [archaeon]|nr:hypothetical protein [Candidatus Naiadarchaeales archaeon SRR2090153.bin1042]
MGNAPTHRAIVKVGDKRWSNIGAGWAKADKISVSLDHTPVPENGKMRFLLVPSTKRTAAGKEEVPAEV